MQNVLLIKEGSAKEKIIVLLSETSTPKVGLSDSQPTESLEHQAGVRTEGCSQTIGTSFISSGSPAYRDTLRNTWWKSAILHGHTVFSFSLHDSARFLLSITSARCMNPIKCISAVDFLELQKLHFGDSRDWIASISPIFLLVFSPQYPCPRSPMAFYESLPVSLIALCHALYTSVLILISLSSFSIVIHLTLS